MNDVADHEARFHDHGEHVDEPYPQQSEDPLRTGVAKITATGGDGTYTITEQIWTGAAWTNGTAPGQYVSAAARDLNNSADGSNDDYVLFWEQYDQNGVIELIIYVPAGAGGDDEKVGVDAEATPGYLGAACNDGVLRAGCGVKLADGGDWVTLYVDDDYIRNLTCCIILDASKKVAVDAAATPDYLGASRAAGVLRTCGYSIDLADGGDWVVLYHNEPQSSGYAGGCNDAGGCTRYLYFLDVDCLGHVRCWYSGDGDDGCTYGPCAVP